MKHRPVHPLPGTKSRLDACLPEAQSHLPVWLPLVPAYLAERARRISLRESPADSGPREGPILYWMHHALRVDENPALELAISLATQFGRPLLVYLGLSERYRFASDRHHAFILQGMVDVRDQLAAMGIPVVMHVERSGHRGPHLRTLARSAAVVVTEEMPVEPILSWLDRLAATVEPPLIAVDTSCVVPMRLVGEAFDRAFTYRDATRELLAERLTRTWSEPVWTGDRGLPVSLPFEPVNPSVSDLAALIGACEIDHLVAPVAHTIGGTTAGMARWLAFRRTKIKRYADDRNDALLDGVSRLSPYLHYGMVSPFRVAREAAALHGPGPAKFLDEVLIWRELAWSFCFHRRDHGRMTALPVWAIRSLVDHEPDDRPALFDWERLARGETGDPLWDAAQKSLLIHGEVHNNVRMTWGKALLKWTPSPGHALEMLIDLNHRYALDGRDPSSYGGLLWCLGQFDRPFTPVQPIYGAVRTRTTREHSHRLDPATYGERTSRPSHDSPPRVAVIGAGLSGLVCARMLSDHGFPVELFEKSTVLGGRMATRQTESGREFDHGAQYFTARSESFRRYVTAWGERGLVSPWTERIVELADNVPQPLFDQPDRFVAVPGMTAVATHLARGLRVHRGVKVVELFPSEGGWSLRLETASREQRPTSALVYDGAETVGAFGAVVLALPAPQAAHLLRDRPFERECAAVAMTPCLAAAMTFAEPSGLTFGGAFVSGSPIRWAARNSGKPGRSPVPETWVLHATAEWSHANLDRPLVEVAALLTAAFAERLGCVLPPVVDRWAHRWMFATAPRPRLDGCLFDATSGLVVAGDWLAGNRVEGAFLSGSAAAGAIARHWLIPRRT